jgi:hypothetical protein
MSSQRRTISSRANGAKSHGPTTPEGKQRSSRNATTHGFFADCVLLDGEDPEALEQLIQEHMERFQPADGVEDSIVYQICAAQWRLYRVLTMETQALNKQQAILAGNTLYPLSDAFEAAGASPSMALLQRHESRLQLIHQRALRSLKLLRTIDGGPNESTENKPSPITEQPEPVLPDPPPSAQPADTKPLVETCANRPASFRPPLAAASPAANMPAQPPASPGVPPPSPKVPGGAV